MHTLNFMPIGNGDCCRIDLANSQKLLFDYANLRNTSDKNDRRIDLAATLGADLDKAKRDYYDVVAFTHLDDDHIHGASEFFHLRHSAKYQGEGRIKINTLWVPAAVIVEDQCEDEAKVIQDEARHRFRQGDSIRVFSRPDKLKDWLKKQGIALEDRKHLITDAGQTISEFSLTEHEVEFFVHSPFATRLNDGGLMDRNDDSLFLQATFLAGGQYTKLLLTADVTHEILTAIVDVTRFHKRDARLEWDVINVPHHTSYKSLGPDKGKNKTEPVENVKWLYEEKGNAGGILVSTSWVIPTADTDQPPHRQAANYYKGVAQNKGGEYVVTMEHTKETRPEPLVIVIDGNKAKVVKESYSGVTIITGSQAPRAGGGR